MASVAVYVQLVDVLAAVYASVATPLELVRTAPVLANVPQEEDVAVKITGSPARLPDTVAVAVPDPVKLFTAIVFDVGGLSVWVIMAVPEPPVPDSVAVMVQKPDVEELR